MEPADNQDVAAFVAGLTLEAPDYKVSKAIMRGGGGGAAPRSEKVVDLGALLGLARELTGDERDDVLESVQFAQRAAGGEFDRFSDTQKWYAKFIHVLERLGWVIQDSAIVEHDQSEGDLKMDRHALKLLGKLATQNALGLLEEVLGALEHMADDKQAVELFRENSVRGRSGNLQVGVAEHDPNGGVSLAMGAYLFRSTDRRRKFLFVGWGANDIMFWSSAHRMTLNQGQYRQVRQPVRDKLGNAADYIAEIKLD